MKKLFFSALAVCAVVTSTLAVTANPADVLFFDNPSIAGSDCLLSVPFRTITVTSQPLGTLNYGITSSAAPCPLTGPVYQSN